MFNPLLFSANALYHGSERRSLIEDVLKHTCLRIETTEDLGPEYVRLPNSDNVPYIFVNDYRGLNGEFDGGLIPFVPVGYRGEFQFAPVKDIKMDGDTLDNLIIADLADNSEILFKSIGILGVPLGFPILKLKIRANVGEKKEYFFNLGIPKKR